MGKAGDARRLASVSATGSDLCRSAIEVLRIESEAIAALIPRVGEAFAESCERILACTGRVVVTGMGKSGHVARKTAATLASAGTPAFFLHPGEASHGDLGMITPADVVIALSNSGETEEILTILPLIKRMGAPLVAMTGNAQSRLAREADVHIDVGVAQEACPLGLAPTASTTAALAMGDAIAIALLEARGFGPEDFARSHPGGRLGRRLLLHISDVMHIGDEIPCVHGDDCLADALVEMTRKSLGMVFVVDARSRVLGVFTDGDLRRTLERGLDARVTAMAEVMTAGCVSVRPEALAAEALNLMQARKVNGLAVLDDDGKLAGALNMHDLLRAGVI